MSNNGEQYASPDKILTLSNIREMVDAKIRDNISSKILSENGMIGAIKSLSGINIKNVQTGLAQTNKTPEERLLELKELEKRLNTKSAKQKEQTNAFSHALKTRPFGEESFERLCALKRAWATHPNDETFPVTPKAVISQEIKAIENYITTGCGVPTTFNDDICREFPISKGIYLFLDKKTQPCYQSANTEQQETNQQYPTEEAWAVAGFGSKSNFHGWLKKYNQHARKEDKPEIDPEDIKGKKYYSGPDLGRLQSYHTRNRNKHQKKF